MKKFGTFTNPNIQPLANGYYDRFNRDRDRPIPTPKAKRRYPWKRNLSGLLAALAVIGLIFVVSMPDIAGLVSPIAGCTIKGNVSIRSRERIYHVPGQYYYEATKVSPEYGERYFCSEAEAIAAGWRKSGI